jgi:RNA polymerase sigma-70 factor (ECF subfamily)
LAAAKDQAGSVSPRALQELAQLYWFPLYVYIRRHGRDASQAEDLTQEFFARLIERKSLAFADPAKGRFRAFLLTCAKNFLANELEKAQSAKRGGAKRVIALDALDAEARYAIEPADDRTPERIFEQRWAREVLDHVLVRLRKMYSDKHQIPLFEVLKQSLASHADAQLKSEMAAKLGLTDGAVSVAIHRLRRHYRQALRDEIAQTVASPELIDEEIDYLLNCL